MSSEDNTNALILQQRDEVPAGLLLDVLAAGGVTAQTVRLDRGEALPDPGSVALAVSLGSGPSATEPVAQELAWLREARDAGTPILGLGFGAEALTLALGGGVEQPSRPRRGLVHLSTSVPELVPAGPWLAWSDHRVVLAPGAELLAHDEHGPQAFRADGHLGIHVHPHLTPEIVGAWVADHRDGDLDTQALLEGISRERSAITANAYRLLSSFVAAVSRARTPAPSLRRPLRDGQRRSQSARALRVRPRTLAPRREQRAPRPTGEAR
jgi:GMP synthase-like glutamine amidotransferase